MKNRTLFDILIGLCAILFLTITSCEPESDNGPMITVNPTVINFDADPKQDQTITVSSNTSWSTQCDSWLTCSPASGTGDGRVTIHAQNNTGDERTTDLTFIDTKTRKVNNVRVKVTQKKADSQTQTNPDQSLSVNPSSLNFSSSAGNKTFNITSNTSWTVKSSETWCSVNTASGSNNATVTVNVTENTSTSSARNATITVSNSSASAIIMVSQDPAGISLDISDSSVSFTYSGGSKSVTIKSNTSWNVSCNESWLTVSPSQGTGDGTLTLKAAQNPTTSERNAMVWIKYDERTSKLIEVSQEARSTNEYSETTGTMPSLGPIGTTKYVTCTLNDVNFTMMEVEGGTFTMGATSEQDSNIANIDESPTHSVTLSTYLIGETEVTQELWYAVMGNNPSYYTGPKRPVENVSWDDCQTFITKLNTMTGKNFRLPTEAEWEFAARGGKYSAEYKYSGSNNIDDVAWYDNNSQGTTHDVKEKGYPNELWLHDMSGNVWEWCQDWYGSYSSSSQRNPTGPSSGSSRVYRGGNIFWPAFYCRLSYRRYGSPDTSKDGIGLRLAR